MPVGNANVSQYGHETRFKPGHKSTGRRPVGTGPAALQDKLEKYLNLETAVVLPDGSKEKREVIDGIVLGLLAKASRGDIAAVKEVFDRYYGKLTDKVELTGKDGNPLAIEHSAHLSQVYDGMKDAFKIEALEKNE